MILFFTYRVSLATWAERGILGRETEPYRRLLPHLGEIAFLTYGVGDARFADALAPIRVLPRPPRLADAPWSLLAPALRARDLRAARVLKTNQVSGAWTGVLAKRRFGTPLIVRSGYPWTFNYDRESPRAWRRRLVFGLERLAVRAADRVVATTERLADYLARTHRLDRSRLRVVPNHVDVERFAPGPPGLKEKGLVAFAGRLSAEKNLGALVQAVGRVPGARLVLMGDGGERERLAALAAEAGVALELAGTVPNDRLAGLLRRAEVFVLPSRYEGQPKALLEAMASGLAVVGADVPGIRDLIRHAETGWLTDAHPEAIADGLRTLLGDAALRERLGGSARAEVARRYALDAVVARELEVIRELTG